MIRESVRKSHPSPRGRPSFPRIRVAQASSPGVEKATSVFGAALPSEVGLVVLVVAALQILPPWAFYVAGVLIVIGDAAKGNA